MPTPVGGPALLWMALLLFSLDGELAALQKTVISLNPPWNRIFRGENVTLTCKGRKFSEVNSTKWTHNGTVLEVTSTTLDIVAATVNDSGEYRCQHQKHNKSPPVYLEIFSDWLLLQVSPEVVEEGNDLILRCHAWKNRNLYKVTYYKNDRALEYWYENYNLSIPNATLGDSGSYHCTGTFQRYNLKHRYPCDECYASEPFSLTVVAAQHSKNTWVQLLIPFLVLILFAVDTGLLISTQQQFIFLLKFKRTRKDKKPLNPQPKSDSPQD
ncbi:high affinity immunoglobulin epsilon receptor subunit alpha [Tupaia chinensis]|uniref:high affinity immunoglobulin epsilon receptor subunit alpha n=1 Tax=Tupaia chinensis TaxID=246437 RepID=UPI000703D241|nr:high affinity immunoglobulin epsilon receptor subunit alpha [Tupaia chinensis]